MYISAEDTADLATKKSNEAGQAVTGGVNKAYDAIDRTI